MSFANRLASKYEVDALKQRDQSPLSRALDRFVIQAVKGEIPLYNCDTALHDILTKVDPEEAKEHHDNLKRMLARLKDIESCLEKCAKDVQNNHAGAVLQKGKNYL